MKKSILLLNLFGIILLPLLSGCSSKTIGMARMNVLYEFGRQDMEVSNQMTASAESTRIVGIDWSRLFNSKSGNFNKSGYAGVSDGSIPIVGSYVDPTKVQNYALYELLEKDKTYDFVLYPRFEEDFSGIPFIFNTTKTRVTARLGRLK